MRLTTCHFLAAIVILAGMVLFSGPAGAAAPDESWLAAGDRMARKDASANAAGPAEVAAPSRRMPPQRLHTLEGVGGGWIVPTAYLANPEPKYLNIFGMPAVSVSFLGWPGNKNMLSFAVSETLFGRVELSYALNRFDMGNLAHVVRRTINNSLRDRGVWLHHMSVRGLLIEEDSFGLPLPALTAGVHFKCNSTIKHLNGRLGIPLDAIGYERSNGVEFTLTASKTIDIKPLPRTVVTVGMRNSDASNIGILGFGDHRKTTIEVGVQVFVLDNVVLSYEFRRKEQQFSGPPVSGMLRGEENWHAFGVGWHVTENLSVNFAVLCMGNVANMRDATAPAIQVRWAF